MHIFYVPDIIINPVLDEQESHHALKVMRLGNGDIVTCVDGKGNFYLCEINIISAKIAALNVIDTFCEKPKNFRIHMAVAPTKNIDRFEWFLEKVTEIGIDEITPVLCEHSERKTIKKERLEKIIISAMKQSGKAKLPILNELTDLDDFVSQVTEDQKYIGHLIEGEERRELLKVFNGIGNVCVLIGPEGDFSLREVENANSFGFINVSLGDSRLRTETAAIVACHTCVIKNELSKLI